jgi:sugar (glycoside-pentoside-hexuronide) transporter
MNFRGSSGFVPKKGGTMSTKRISWKTKIGYGAPGWATLFTFTMFTTYGLFFFTDVVGLSAAFAGLIMSIGTIWDAISDPIVGTISDMRDPKKGRRRPFMFWVAIPFGIATWLLFTDFGLGAAATKAYFIIVALFFYTVQTLIDIPYTALSGEMTADYDERSTLGSVRIVWALLGVIFGGMVLFFTGKIQEVFSVSEQAAWSFVFAGFGVLCTVSIYIGWKATKGYEDEDAANVEKFSFKSIVDGPLKNVGFLHVAGAFIFGIIAQAIFLGSMTYYLYYNLNLSDGQVASVNTIMWIIGLLWVWPVNKLSQAFSKKVSWNFSFGIWLICMLVFPWLINKPGSVFAPIVMFSILVVGLNALYQVVYALIPDCVEVDELKNGERKEGIYYSTATISQKTASAIAISILGSVLTAIGYDASVAPGPSTLEGIKVIFSIGTAVACLLSILCIASNPLNKKRYGEVCDALERKRAGETIDMNEFRDLIK